MENIHIGSFNYSVKMKTEIKFCHLDHIMLSKDAVIEYGKLTQGIDTYFRRFHAFLYCKHCKPLFKLKLNPLNSIQSIQHTHNKRFLYFQVPEKILGAKKYCYDKTPVNKYPKM